MERTPSLSDLNSLVYGQVGPAFLFMLFLEIGIYGTHLVLQGLIAIADPFRSLLL